MGAINQANTDTAGQLVGLLTALQSPTVTALTLVSGTAQQDATNLPSTVYVNIGLHAGGSVAIAIGPTSAVANAVIPAGEDATVQRTHAVSLPAGWWIKVTVSGAATIAGAIQITG